MSKTIKYFFKFIIPHKKKLSILLIVLLLNGVATFIAPFFTQSVVDKGIKDKNVQYVAYILLCQLLLFLGNSLISIVRSWLMVDVNNNVGISLVHDFLKKIAKLPISYFDKKIIGDLQQRINDNSRIQSFLISNSLTIVVCIINFIAFVISLAYFNWRILLITIFSSLISIAWMIFFLKKRKKIDHSRFSNMSSSQDKLYEIFSGMQEIKLNTCEDEKINEWYKIQKQSIQINLDSFKVNQLQSLGSGVFAQLENIIISFVSAYDVINNRMSLGAMMSVSFIAGQLKGTIQQFSALIQSYQDAAISTDRLLEIHKLEDEDGDNRLKLTSFEISDITLKNVSFTYKNSHAPALKNINLKIPRGKITAIVGGSGSGKTTLLKILLKYHTAQTGTILINSKNNIDLKNISSSSWRERCGVVMQDGFIFSDTIKSNIIVKHNDGSSEHKLFQAAEIANLTDFIENLPNKWDTLLDTKNEISGGEKQRILIARAAYKNPDILFFDEATSSLDLENEKIITQNIESHFKHATKIIIAHRLSTIKNADQIIVLDKGEIVEIGDHNSLMENKYKYFNLFSTQVENNQLV